MALTAHGQVLRLGCNSSVCATISTRAAIQVVVRVVACQFSPRMVAAHTLACAVAVAVLLAFPAFAAALPRPAAADFLSDAAASGSDSDEGPGAALRAHLGLEWRSELTVLAATAARVPLGAPVSLSLSPPALAPGGDLLLAGLLRNTSSGAGVAEGAEGRVSRGLQGADDDLVPPADDAQVDDATPESGWYETQRHPGLLLLMRVRGGAIGAPATDGDALLTEFAFAPQLGVLRDVSGVHVLGVANGDGQGNNTACVCVATAAAQAVCARLGVPWDLGRRADAWVSDAALDGARPVHVDRLQQHVRAPVRAVLAKADSPPSAPSGVLVAAYDAQLNPRSSWESLRLVGIPAQCPAQYATAEAPAVQPWVSRANASFNVGFGVTTNVRPFALSSPALATCSDAHGNFSVVVSAGHSTDNSGSSYVFAARAMTGERVWQYPAQNSFHPIIEQGGGGAVVVVPAASVRAMSGNVSNYRADLACYASGADFSLTCVDACTGDLVTSVNVDIDIPGNIPRAAVALGQPTLAPSSLVADLLHHACPHRVDAPSVLIPLSGPLGSVVVYSLCTDRGPPLSIGGSTALSAIATGYHSSSGDGSTELSPPAPVFVPTASSAARPVLCFGQPVVNVAGRGGNSDSLFKLSWPVAVQVGTYASCIELGLVDPNDVDFPDGVVTAARYAFLWTRPEAVFAMAQDDAGGVVFVASQSSWAAGSNFYYSASAECDVNELGAVAIDDHPVRQVCEACINVVDPGGTGDDTDGQPWVLVGALPDSPGLRLGMSSYNKVFSEAVLCTTMNNGRMKLGSGCQIGASDVWFPTTSGTSSSSLTSNIMCIDSVNGQHQGQGYDYNDDYGDDDLGSGLSSGPVVSVPTWNDDDITGRGGAVAMAVDCRAFVADMDGRMVLYILLSLSPAVFTVVALACLIVKRRRRYDVGGLSPLVLGSNCPTTNDLLQRLEREARRTTPPPDDRKFGCLRRSARRCCRLCRAPRHQVPSVTHAALLASVRRFNVFLGAAWVSGLLFNFAARAWAGLPFFEFFTATDHDCAAGTGNPDGLGLNYMSGTALQWSIVCGAVYSIAAFIRSRPTPDANLRFFGLLAAAPLIWSSIWVLEWSGGVMNGLGPQFAVALGGTSTIFWCTLALGQVLEVPIQHPFFASGAPWGALARSHRLGVYLVYCVGGWLVVLLCTPFGAWVQVNLTPLVAPGVVVLANQLLSVESRTALVGAVEAWRQLGSDMEVPTEAVDADATRKRTRLHPAVLVRVHALSSLLPLVVIGHAAGLLDVILLQLGRDGDNPYSIDGLPLPDGYLPGPVVYAVIVAMGAASVLRALALQSAVKRSGENALFRLRAGAMRLPPLLPPSVADSLRRARQDVLPAAGAGAARKKATGEPSMAEDVANWATSWSGQQVLSFTSHVTSISSLCFKLASGGMIDERGAQCIDFILSVNPAEVAVFAISISSVGFLVSLHTVLSRHFFPRVARMIPVDDSFRITIALKTTAIALCVPVCDAFHPRSLTLLVFVCVQQSVFVVAR